MSALLSPGISVSVIDESFYASADPGTTPLIIIASEENKRNVSNTGVVSGTLKANAGRPYLLTSQKDLVDFFGVPIFKTDANNNPIHGSELNEYGLQAAYSFLGVSNRVFVVRADVDLLKLVSQVNEPDGDPDDGTYWFDVNSRYGIFEWDVNSVTVPGVQAWNAKYPKIIIDQTLLENEDVSGKPAASFGAVGEYVVVATTNLIRLYFKKPVTITDTAWVEVGSLDWISGRPTVNSSLSNVVGLFDVTDNLSVNGIAIPFNTVGSLVTDMVTLAAKINAAAITGVNAAVINDKLEIYSDGTSVAVNSDLENVAGGVKIASTNPDTLEKLGIEARIYLCPALQISSHTDVPPFKDRNYENNRPTGSIWIRTTIPNLGADWSIRKYNESTKIWEFIDAPIYRDHQTALALMDPRGGINLNVNSLYIKYNDDESNSVLDPMYANFKIYKRNSVGATGILSKIVDATTFESGETYEFKISESLPGTANFSTEFTVSFVGAGTSGGNTDRFLAALNALTSDSLGTAGLRYVRAERNSFNQIIIRHTTGGEIKLVDTETFPDFIDPDTNNFVPGPIGTLFSLGTSTEIVNFYLDPTNPGPFKQLGDNGKYVASLWTELTYITSVNAPPNMAPEGTLWYNADVIEVDIMIKDDNYWRGYLNYDQRIGMFDNERTDPLGPIISPNRPKMQSDGTTLANGDLWIDTSDIENFPKIYKFDKLNGTWILIDNSDQTTENGIVFDDARAGTNGGFTTVPPTSSIVELLNSDFLDPDAPDPALYPKGTLLWNLRRSTFNVKKMRQQYIDINSRNMRFNGYTDSDGNQIAAPIGPGSQMDFYYPHRWVSASPNNADGSGTFGRKAQRAVVVQALQAAINGNLDIRDAEARIFNLIACPGYPELVQEMITLNYDRGVSSFVVCDTPSRLLPDATSMLEWGINQKLAVEDNDNGLVSYDPYIGFFYPWGYTSDNLGNNIVVPPSHMILRMITLSDSNSYPWYAPAGTRRGAITNASSVGYITDEGEFKSIALNNGQRDTMASVKVNPIAFMNGTGLVNYGQYTRSRDVSSLDRINVARLVIYLRQRLSVVTRPFIFEPNDGITREQAKAVVESVLLDIVSKRGAYDYFVQCDEGNNTPARIDRNEMYIDVAISPMKTVEFIYIPIRLKNTDGT